MESNRDRRPTSKGMETNMARGQSQGATPLPDIIRERRNPYPVEEYQDHSTQEAKKGGLNNSRGVEAYFASLRARQSARVGGR